MFNLSDIILGNVVGRSLCHVWYDEHGQDKAVYTEMSDHVFPIFLKAMLDVTKLCLGGGGMKYFYLS